MTSTVAAGNRPKIFGIGLSKTGTSSLAQALQRLGFRTKDCMGAARYVPGDLSSIDMETVLAHDALTDTPIPSFYRELDARFPGSRFILTVREREGWLQSCRKQFNERSAAAQNDAHRRLFEDLYGTNVFDAERFASGYDRFVAGVREHFKDRPGDLLVIDVTAGEGWEKLCPFLGCPVPDVAFPKANVTQIRWIDIEELASIAETAGRELMQHYEGAVAPGAAATSAPRRLLRRALQVAAGRDALHSAMRSGQHAIASALARRTPGIPVISPLEDAPAFDERRLWNHAWLVDPLDGADAFAAGRADFTVDLALVEDGRPIYGVVHAPALGLTYFGRTGKGAFVRRVGEPAARLEGPRPAHAGAGATAGPAESPSGAGSHALALCRVLEGTLPADALLPPAPEWRAAAGHAIVHAQGGLEPVGNDGAAHEFNGRALSLAAQRLRVRDRD